MTGSVTKEKGSEQNKGYSAVLSQVHLKEPQYHRGNNMGYWIQLNTITHYQHNSTALKRKILKKYLYYIDARMFWPIITLKTCGVQTGRDLYAE